MTTNYLETTVRDFQDNLATYVCALQNGMAKAILVKRYTTPIGVFILLDQVPAPTKNPEDCSPGFLETETNSV